MRAAAFLGLALLWVMPSPAQPLAGQSTEPLLELRAQRPQLQLGRNSFALPVIDYSAPDGSLKRSRGVIVSHDIAAGTTVGLGFYRMGPKARDSSPTLDSEPVPRRSRKVAVGLTFKF